MNPRDEKHIGLIVEPLRALTRDQVDRWSSMGVSCAGIFRKSEMDPAVIEGRVLIKAN